jgi:hypothetical protein
MPLPQDARRQSCKNAPAMPPADQPRPLDGLEERLWRFAAAMTGDRTRATRILCSVLFATERPGRRGADAPPGEFRLLRSIALAARDMPHANDAPTPPFKATASPDAATLWSALHRLPRAQRFAWLIGVFATGDDGDVLRTEDAAVIMGVPLDEFASLREAASVALAEDGDPHGIHALRKALTPTSSDAVPDALAEVRHSSRRRWRVSTVLIILAVLIFMIVFGAIMVDLVSRDERDEQDRHRRDELQQEFSNPMPNPAPTRTSP